MYNFNYGVEDPLTGTNFDHNEARDGPSTRGSYQVALPDGRLQTVEYSVDGDSGYIADVKYTSGAPIAAPVPAYAPAPIVIRPRYP